MEEAIQDWINVLGAARVLTADEAQARYRPNTYGETRRIAAAVFPQTTDQVAQVVKIARRHRVPIYPISTGRNWGDGTASPITHDCVIVDLSRMNSVLNFDDQLDVVTLQPGVTQRDLREFLDRRGLRYLVPTTGAGPSCSIVGNALERGFGITPHADHFGAVTSIEAVLPDGEVYRSATWLPHAPEADRVFKWGLGPHLDGLFSQGNFGIVTEMTIRLVPVPDCIEVAHFSFKEDADLEIAVRAIRQVQRVCGANVGSVNLMNPLRLLATTIPYPSNRVAPGVAMSDHLLAELMNHHRIGCWTGVLAIYGHRRVVRATRTTIREILGTVANRVVFLTENRVRRMKRAIRFLPRPYREQLRPRIQIMEAAFQVLQGVPSEVLLRLAYWRSGKAPPADKPLDPARDGCGLLWYAPLVPMLPERVRAYTQMVKSTCREYGLEPVLTFTSAADGCFVSTVPLLFDQTSADQTERVGRCYEALFNRGKDLGCVPYRGGAPQMRLLVEPEKPFWRFVRQLKQAVDPDNLIAPGRYCPPPSAGSRSSSSLPATSITISNIICSPLCRSAIWAGCTSG